MLKPWSWVSQGIYSKSLKSPCAAHVGKHMLLDTRHMHVPRPALLDSFRPQEQKKIPPKRIQQSPSDFPTSTPTLCYGWVPIGDLTEAASMTLHKQFRPISKKEATMTIHPSQKWLCPTERASKMEHFDRGYHKSKSLASCCILPHLCLVTEVSLPQDSMTMTLWKTQLAFHKDGPKVIFSLL